MATDGSDFDAAWLAFAREEARAAAAPELESRVLARVLQGAAHRAEPRRAAHWRLPAFAAISAAALLAAVVVPWFGGKHPDVLPAKASWDHAGDVALRAQVAVQRPEADDTVGAHRERLARLPAVSRALIAELPPPLLRFSAQPIGETEILQIVRLRLPREALQSLGVILVDPDAEGMVDVDVLVGEDGLARDIRQVSSGQE